MKLIRSQIRIASFVVAIVLLLQISPALADDRFYGRVELIFLKWVVGAGPLMAGVVSGDVGGGTFAGEILSASQTDNMPHQEKAVRRRRENVGPQSEPPRVFRRLFGLSHAAMAG